MSDSNSLQRLSRLSISRRRALLGGGLSGLGLVGAGLIGCSSSNNKNSANAPAPATRAAGTAATAVAGTAGTPAAAARTAVAGAPVARKGTLRFDVQPLKEALDPAIAVSAAAPLWQAIGNLAVTADKQTWTIKPALVESWELPSPAEVILHVRKNVSWHNKVPTNGRAVTADDVAYSINRHAGKLDPGKEGQYNRRGNFVGLDKAETVDAQTVRLRMSSPSGAILNGLADQRVSMLPIESKDVGFADPQKLAGTGPWMIKNMDQTGQATLVPNLQYWEPGLPKAAQLDIAVINDYQTETASYLSDQIDWLSMTNHPAADLDTIQKSRGNAKKLVWDFGYIHYYRFNTKRQPFADPRVRRALQLTLDSGALGTAFYGDLWKYTGPLVSTFVKEAYSSDDIAGRPGWNSKTKDKDIADAKQLMTAAGFPDGGITLPLIVFNTPPHVSNATRTMAQWNRVWPAMKVSIDGPLDNVPYFQKINGGDFSLMVYAQFPSPDAVLELASNYTPQGGRNYGAYDNPELTALVQKAQAELDANARIAETRSVQDILLQDMPLIPMYFARQAAFVDPTWSGIDGFPGPAGGATWDIWEGSKLVTKG